MDFGEINKDDLNKIVICILTRNSDRYIMDTVEEFCMHQTYKKFHLVVIDNCSDDDKTIKILSGFNKALVMSGVPWPDLHPIRAQNFLDDLENHERAIFTIKEKFGKVKAFRFWDDNAIPGGEEAEEMAKRLGIEL